MSNILLDDLPETVFVDGEEFFVDTDFRTFIIFEKILTEDDDDRDKVENVLSLFFIEDRPKNVGAAINAVIDLYRCGEEPKKAPAKRKNGNVEMKQKLIYDYEHDAPYIYGAFMSQYGIDLNDIEYLHWWKFQALFRSLEDHNKIVEIMSIRNTDLSKIKDSKERSRIARLQSIYALPQHLTREEKIAMAGAAFGGF